MQKEREFLGEKCKRFPVRASPSKVHPKFTILPHDGNDVDDYDDEDDEVRNEYQQIQYQLVDCSFVGILSGKSTLCE